MERIANPRDTRLLDYNNLTDAAAGKAGIFIVEGLLAVQRLMDCTDRTSASRIRSVLLTPSRAATLTDLATACSARRIPLLVADRSLLHEVTGFDVHRGVLAAVQRTEMRSLTEVLDGAQRIVVLEGINDHENIGSIFRNAAALQVDAVLLDSQSSDPLYRRSIRVSSGHVLSTPWTRVAQLHSSLTQISQEGFRIVGMTPHLGALAVDAAAVNGILDSPVAFVLGAEGPGLSDATLRACDYQVRIPMRADVDSLNVATSLAVVASFAAARHGWSDKLP
ncbi:MAG: RNA methyltransferase [Actinomycetes bacterium]